MTACPDCWKAWFSQLLEGPSLSLVRCIVIMGKERASSAKLTEINLKQSQMTISYPVFCFSFKFRIIISTHTIYNIISLQLCLIRAMCFLLQLVNLVGCQLECKTYSDMLKTIKLYLELFYTAENGSIAMRKYKAKSNELEANCTDSLWSWQKHNDLAWQP